MSVQYYGYNRMPENLYDTFASEDLIQAKQQFKQFPFNKSGVGEKLYKV